MNALVVALLCQIAAAGPGAPVRLELRPVPGAKASVRLTFTDRDGKALKDGIVVFESGAASPAVPAGAYFVQALGPEIFSERAFLRAGGSAEIHILPSGLVRMMAVNVPAEVRPRLFAAAFAPRMPSALDNRPLTFEEFEHRTNQIVYVSATPGPYELTKTAGVVVEQVIRPTGLIDPPVEIRPVKGQIDDLLHMIRDRVARNERVLVTTLTKRMSEDLAEYYSEVGVKCRYMHSEIETLERVKILRDLRKGEFDVLIGINLLREGLDLPEVSLVAIL